MQRQQRRPAGGGEAARTAPTATAGQGGLPDGPYHQYCQGREHQLSFLSA